MKKLKKILSSIMLTVFMITSLNSITVSAISTESVLNNPELNNYINDYIEQNKTPGLALAVVNDEEITFRNWGYDSIKNDIPITEQSAFELGSTSKAFTALSILLLQEECKLSIEDSVSDYLPWFNVNYNGENCDIKIWHLLNHCSGLPDQKTMRKIKTGTDEKLKEETARIAEGITLNSEPGTNFEYCNLGYNILAYLTETVSGQSFESYVTSEIFEPLGMKNSGYDIPTVQGYQCCFGQLIEYNAPRFKGCQGDGYVITTADDMTLWIKAQMGYTKLPEKLDRAIKFSHTFQENHPNIELGQLEDGRTTYYYNGWIQTKDGNFMSHSGGNPNFTTMLFIDKDKNIATFAASNSQNNTPMMVATVVREMLSGMDLLVEDVVSDPTDTIATIFTIAGLILLIGVIIALATLKKRLLKHTDTPQKEKRRFIRFLALIPMLIIFVSLPYIVGANYTMAAIWTPYSVLTAIITGSVAIAMTIILGISRYIMSKKCNII